MNSMQIISVVVFLVVMIALVTEKVHRTAAAVSGAVLLLCLRILSVDEAVSYIDFGTIGVLIGMMLFVAVVRNSGLFEYMAIKSAKIAKGSPWKIMLLFMILTAVLSAFLDNVTTVLLVGPMAISIAGILGIDPVPFLLTQILASNIGGTATLIGDPPNIMIGSKAGLSFADFVVTTGPAVILIMIVICALFYVVYGRPAHGGRARAHGSRHGAGRKARCAGRNADEKEPCHDRAHRSRLCLPLLARC